MTGLAVLAVICSVRARPRATEAGAAVLAMSVVVAGLCLLAAMYPLGSGCSHWHLAARAAGRPVLACTAHGLPWGMTSNRVFMICVAWVIAGGLLLSEGTIHHALPAFVAGAVMSAICPVGLVAVTAFRRGPRRLPRADGRVRTPAATAAPCRGHRLARGTATA